MYLDLPLSISGVVYQKLRAQIICFPGESKAKHKQRRTTSRNFMKNAMCFVIFAETHLNNPKQCSLWNK